MITTATFTNTMTVLTLADSRMPMMIRTVTATVMRTAGRLKTAVTSPRRRVNDRAGRRRERRREVDADEVVQETREVAAPADRDRRRAERVLEDQVPADDPGEELAERRVAVGVGRAGNRHGRRELRVAEAGERRRDAREDHREHDGRAGVGGRDLAGQDEDAGADDGADAERDEVDRDRARASGCARPVCAAWAVSVSIDFVAKRDISRSVPSS